MTGGWDPILPGCDGISMGLLIVSINLLRKPSGLWHELGQPFSCHRWYFKIASQQQGRLDGCHNRLGTVPRPRLGAAWDPLLVVPPRLPGAGGVEALWVALPC